MSIENNLKRIADSLERIANCMESGASGPKPDTAPDAATNTGNTASATPAPDSSAPPAAPAAATPPTDAPPPPPTTAPAMTAEELNAELVKEFNRLGGREGIDGVMKEFGVTSVNQLAQEQYQNLLDQVRALQP